MNKLFCSIIIPAYNSEKTIEKTLESVKIQTHQNFEVLIIDDGSTDKTYTICRDFIEKNKFSQWHLFHHSNQGVSYTRNHGVTLSRSNLLFFLDSDDTWEQDKINKTLNFMQENNLDMCGESFRYFDLNNNISRMGILSRNPFITSSVCLKKNVYLNVGGFNITQKYSEDYNLWLKIILNGGTAKIIPEKLTNYFIDSNANSLSKNKKKMFHCELLNFREMKKNKYINQFEYIYSIAFSSIKYLKRNISK